MSSRASLNKVMLIGNLTRDPEMRYTPSGAAVCTFSVATNRYYVASDGNKKEETEFIKIVSWNKLAELCSQLLSKGRKVYVEGRMQTRSWETPDGQNKQTTEVVIDDMRILDSRKDFDGGASEAVAVEPVKDTEAVDEKVSDVSKVSSVSLRSHSGQAKVEKEKDKSDDKKKDKDKAEGEDVDLDDLPF